jgi:hypothetical protein
LNVSTEIYPFSEISLFNSSLKGEEGISNKLYFLLENFIDSYSLIPKKFEVFIGIYIYTFSKESCSSKLDFLIYSSLIY